MPLVEINTDKCMTESSETMFSCESLRIGAPCCHQIHRIVPRPGLAFVGDAEYGLKLNIGKAHLCGALAQTGLVEAVVLVDFRAVK